MVGIAVLLFAFTATSCPEHFEGVRSALEQHNLTAASTALETARPLCSQQAQFQRFGTLIKALQGGDAEAQALLEHDPPFFLFYAGTLLEGGQIKHLNNIVSTNAAALSPPLLFSLAGLYARNRQYQQTIALLKRIPAQQADEAVCFNLGLAYSLTRQFAEARRNYFAAIDKHPEYAEAYLRIGIDYAEVGQPRWALPWLYRARELSPDRSKVDYPLAQQLIRLRYLDTAGEILSADLQSHPNEPMLLIAQGDLELARGDNAKARDAYQKSLAAAPGTAPALLGLARCDIAEANSEEAQKYLQQILAADPNNPAANAELGAVELSDNNQSSAMLHLDHAWSTDPSKSNTAVGVPLARLLRQSNQPARALAVLERLDPAGNQSVELHLELARVYQALHRVEQARSEQQLVKSLQTQSATALHFDDPKTYVQ
jgi:tetratricopeptide (TPR) repeat protein